MYEIQEIPLDIIQFDYSYQREPLQSRGLRRTMLNNWDENLCDPIAINIRPDNSHFSMDGQNRVLTKRDRREATILSKVFRGLTIQQEAKYFVDVNDWRKVVAQYDKFRARLRYDDPIAIEITATLNQYGISHGKYKKKYSTYAVGTLEKLYNWNILDRTLYVCESCWGGGEQTADPHFLESYLMQGIGTFLHNLYQNGKGTRIRPSSETFIEAIKKGNRISPDSIIRVAKNKTFNSSGDSLRRAIADVCVDIYNTKHRGQNRLVSLINP